MAHYDFDQEARDSSGAPVVLPPRESLGQRQTQIEIFALQKPAKRFFLLLTLSLGISWPHHATDDVFLDLISSRNIAATTTE